MVRAGGRGPLVWIVIAAGAAVLAVTVAALTGPGSPSEPMAPDGRPATTDAESPAPDDAPRAGRSALVSVAVANVWKEPGMARPVDEPSVTNPVDIRGWVASMSHEDKLWLVDHLVTQALYGEEVGVREIRDGGPASLSPASPPTSIPRATRAGSRPSSSGRPTSRRPPGRPSSPARPPPCALPATPPASCWS